jgi:hypothetical protein
MSANRPSVETVNPRKTQEQPHPEPAGQPAAAVPASSLPAGQPAAAVPAGSARPPAEQRQEPAPAPRQANLPADGVEELAARMLASAHKLAEEVERNAHARAGAIEQDGRKRAEELVAQARNERDSMAGELQELINNATWQVNELLQIREELTQEIQRIVKESAGAVRQVHERARSAIVEDDKLTLESPPAARKPETTPAPPAPKAPSPTPDLAAVPVSLAAARADRSAGDAEIELTVRPFPGVAEVIGFERKLRALPGVRDVYVRCFTGDRIDVTVKTDRAERLPVTLRAIPSVIGVDDSGEGLEVTLRSSQKN